MKKIFQYAKKPPWHLILLSMYPILGLWFQNIEQVNSKVIIRPLIFSFLGAILIWRVVAFLIRDTERAAILTSIFFIAFFSYGHVYGIARNVQFLNVPIFRHRTLLIIWILVGALAFAWIKRSKKVDTFKSVLNWISFALVSIFFVELLIFQITQSIPSSQSRENIRSINISYEDDLPDIYYIILDGYSRADVLEQEMGYDNSVFISELENMGFYVAKYSQSNYSQTTLSISSSLNYDYLDSLGVTITEDKLVRRDVYRLLSDNALRRFLEERGYKTVAFATGFVWSELTNATYYLEPNPGAKLNEFEYLLLQTTILRIPLDYKLLFQTDLRNEMFRERTEFTLDKLKTIPFIAGPKFVFVHTLIPHLPFVFGPNGEVEDMDFKDELEYSKDEYIYGYTNQVSYANKRILEIVSDLIQKSETPPIIIIQGDHGSGRFGKESRMRILNAYYLPEQPSVLYETISPVNSFRVVLNTYFGQSLPLLEDKSFFSGYNNPQNFEIIENLYIRK